MKNPQNEDDDKRVLRYIQERKGINVGEIRRRFFIGVQNYRRGDYSLRRLKEKGLIEYRRAGRNGSAWHLVGVVK